jgi:hypothetical protein
MSRYWFSTAPARFGALISIARTPRLRNLANANSLLAVISEAAA